MDLSSDEIILMDSGKPPVSYQENRLGVINGKLILTNKKLIFEPSKFQSIVGSFLLSMEPGSRYIEIPLTQIVRVEKGFMAHLKILTRDKEYSFKGMRGIDKWIEAIERAMLSISPSKAPNSIIQGISVRFCPYCGSPVSPEDVYCRNCGKQLPK